MDTLEQLREMRWQLVLLRDNRRFRDDTVIQAAVSRLLALEEAGVEIEDSDQLCDDLQIAVMALFRFSLELKKQAGLN